MTVKMVIASHARSRPAGGQMVGTKHIARLSEFACSPLHLMCKYSVRSHLSTSAAGLTPPADKASACGGGAVLCGNAEAGDEGFNCSQHSRVTNVAVLAH